MDSIYELRTGREFQTLLAIKNDKIVGFLSGKLKKEVGREEFDFNKVNCFEIENFGVQNDLLDKKQILIEIMLEAMKKTKQIGYAFFSFSLNLTDDYF